MKKSTTNSENKQKSLAIAETINKTITDENGNVIKKTIRTEDEKSTLRTRLNRVIGQLKGIVNMIDEDRFSEDILIQLTSSYKSIKGVTNIILCNHLVSCVKEGVLKEDYNILNEAMEIFKRYQ